MERKKRIYSFNKSFYEWCSENNREDVIERWDYELNKYKPNEIGYASSIKQWFKCPHGIHCSELKYISNFTRDMSDGVIKCNQCNSFGQWLINKYGENALSLYWSNKNTVNPLKISYSSASKIWLICQKCGNEKLIQPYKFIKRGLGCHKCSDGISYCEKFMFNVLQQVKADFKTQLSKTTFSWCKNKDYDYKYDFYCKRHSEDIIIETHGLQHYQDVGGTWIDLESVQKNDRLKRNIAIENGIKEDNYIVIDCRKTELEWVKKSIINSKVSKLYNLSNINWLKCHEFATNSLIKIACNLWNDGIKNIKDISQEMNVSTNSVRNYLKFGTNYGWCDYIPKHNTNVVSVYCVETNMIYNSIKDAQDELGIFNICAAIKRNGKCGGYHWMYYEDYLKLHNNEATN